MKHIIKNTLLGILLLICTFLSFVCGAIVYIWTFSVAEYRKGFKWLNKKIGWIKILDYMV